VVFVWPRDRRVALDGISVGGYLDLNADMFPALSKKFYVIRIACVAWNNIIPSHPASETFSRKVYCFLVAVLVVNAVSCTFSVARIGMNVGELFQIRGAERIWIHEWI
jgi:hypothetical protein